MVVACEALVAAGFVETHYEGQEGVFYTKRLRAADMPFARDFIIDNDSVFPEDEVVLEVTPDRCVQLVVPAGDYIEPAVSVDSERGLDMLCGVLGDSR